MEAFRLQLNRIGRVRDDVDLACRCNARVLITDADAERRRACAYHIHTHAPTDGPFVALEPGDLCGLATVAAGTVFLNDISNLPSRAQQELLRQLERGLGRTRLIAGSSRLLLPDIALGQFDPMLFYRLNVLHIVMPARRAAVRVR